MKKKDMICIVCPIGCHLEVMKDESSPSGYKVTGNQCNRGRDYGIEEMTHPTRVLTSTVKVNNAHLPRLPVRTNGAIPKGKTFECMEAINRVEVTAPIKLGEVIIKDLLGTGVDLIASRSM